MAHDPDYYEVHRKKYLEAIKSAAHEREHRSEEIQRRLSEEQQIAEDAAKILLERHRVKVSKI